MIPPTLRRAITKSTKDVYSDTSAGLVIEAPEDRAHPIVMSVWIAGAAKGTPPQRVVLTEQQARAVLQILDEHYRTGPVSKPLPIGGKPREYPEGDGEDRTPTAAAG